VPTTVLGVLLFVVLLAPGFAHALVKERRSPRQVFSVFRETVSLVLVGIVADTVCLLLFFLVQAIEPDILDVTAFLRDPGGYAAVHYVRLTLLIVGLLGIAAAGAAVAAAKPVRRLAGALRGRPAAGEHQAYLSAWWLLFTANPDSRVHVGCLLDDGSYVAGMLRSFNQAGDDVQDRELTLSGSISYRAPGAPQTTELPGVGAAAVNARRLQLIMVSYLTEDPKADERPSTPPTE
jgi:Family of unknown function (DUF6338)